MTLHDLDTFEAIIHGDLQHDGHTHVLKYERHPSGMLVKPLAIRTPATYADKGQGDVDRPEGVLVLQTYRERGLPVYRWQPVPTNMGITS